jgi:hypothetical protein
VEVAFDVTTTFALSSALDKRVDGFDYKLGLSASKHQRLVLGWNDED